MVSRSRIDHNNHAGMRVKDDAMAITLLQGDESMCLVELSEMLMQTMNATQAAVAVG